MTKRWFRKGSLVQTRGKWWRVLSGGWGLLLCEDLDNTRTICIDRTEPAAITASVQCGTGRWV